MNESFLLRIYLQTLISPCQKSADINWYQKTRQQSYVMHQFSICVYLFRTITRFYSRHCARWTVVDAGVTRTRSPWRWLCRLVFRSGSSLHCQRDRLGGPAVDNKTGRYRVHIPVHAPIQTWILRH